MDLAFLPESRPAPQGIGMLIGGTHHGLGRADSKHLQAYLHEYAYRFNRRHRPDTIFARCVAAVAACPIWTYRDITGTRRAGKKGRLWAA